MISEEYIKKRIEALHFGYANNKAEGIEMDINEFNLMIERAKQPISNEEFTDKELDRIFKKYGLSNV
ncbi:hypothetical protein JP28_03955 [Gallibacterium anatis]|jgi:hypothetical protein|uniref:hypothetical protein n=1 Tax=Gallibacterium anatis TaxID=750 RepID=UPI000530FA15|nr:hypothetical protein [Gallibacterium anatis]KGQ44629.1 hypothetical protein JP28_03955 [Gallibacterium anatis]KGQ47472.1 hypothetical protein IO46_13140 [Gallibacterium anatis]KGQ53035.1 hypothetical protein IO44_11390 [Gallibacterium anatis str. Avicor]